MAFGIPSRPPATPREPDGESLSPGFAGRFAWYVIGYNWLVALTLLPLAVLVAWGLSMRRLVPLMLICCAGYAYLEVTAFFIERAWSRISFLSFWSLALPFCAAQVYFCQWLTPSDALGCMLVSAICLTLRETLFELFFAGSVVGGYEAKERVASALLGGFAYGGMALLLCAGAHALLNAVVRGGPGAPEGHQGHVLELVYALALPVARTLARMVFAQGAGAVDPGVPAALTAGGIGAASAASGPPLDALVLAADLAFVVAVFMEVPFAFALLLVPRASIFCVAAVAGAVLDLGFVWVLDALQRRRLRVATCVAFEGSWAPSYCVDRPRSFIAVVLSGGLLLPEAARLRPQRARTPQQGAAPVPAPGASAPPASRVRVGGGGVGGRVTSLWADCRNCSPIMPSGKDRSCSCELGSGGSDGAMSPRVSLLLDDYDAGVIGSSGHGVPEGSAGLAVYLFQDRTATLTTHLLANTAALAIAGLCVPLLQLHRMVLLELACRIGALLLLRLVVDFAACCLQEAASSEVHHSCRAALWEGRLELATLHGWLLRALAAAGPLFAVLAVVR